MDKKLPGPGLDMPATECLSEAGQPERKHAANDENRGAGFKSALIPFTEDCGAKLKAP